MKRIISLLAATLIAVTALADDAVIPFGATSVILTIKATDLDTGKGKTGMTNATAGLIVSARPNVSATATVYAQASSNLETIATLGTYAAPTASKARIKLVDDTNQPGVYEIQLADAIFATAGARFVDVCMTGVVDLDDPCTKVVLGLPYNVVSGRLNNATLQSATSTSAVIAATETSSDNHWAGQKIVGITGTNGGTYGCVLSNVNATDTLTIDAWTGGTPDSTTTYDIIPDANCKLVAEMTAGGYGTGTLNVFSMVRFLYERLGGHKVAHNRNTSELEIYNTAGTKVVECPTSDAGNIFTATECGVVD